MRTISPYILCMFFLIVSCSKEYDTPNDITQSTAILSTAATKGIGEKTPETIVVVDIENDNPLNAGDYFFTGGDTFFDYVCLFSAYIHSSTAGGIVTPTLYLSPVMTSSSWFSTYVTPLQSNNQGVLLCITGDWMGIGLSSMNSTQAYQFATILAYVVSYYDLDGVVFDDEYSGTSTIVYGSYSGIITYFKQLCPNKLVFVIDCGGTSYISSTAAGEIDYALSTYSGYYLPYYYSSIPDIDYSRWSPISLNLGQTYSSSALYTIQSWVSSLTNDGYGAIAFVNLHDSNYVDPLPVLQTVSLGAGWDPVYCSGGSNSYLPTVVPGGYTITYSDALQGMTP